ncbi:hypothetical protein OROGR_009597 [Orobanche gracilis]
MASVNLSFCIFFVLGFALVGRMVQVVDAARELDDSPFGAVKLSGCAIGLHGQCDHTVNDEKNCEIACKFNIGDPANFWKSACLYGGEELCYCSYWC